MINSGVFEMVRLGGPLMWAILVASVLAFAIFVERLIYFHRSSMPLEPFLKGITNLLRQNRPEEALERCDEAYGPAVRVVQAAILKRHLPKEDLKELTQEVAQLQMPRLEAHLPALATIAYISPLLGLLGTVLGMIQAFMNMNVALGATPINDLAAGIWEALLTTAGGLSVAIPAYVAYSFLVARLQGIVTDMERAAIEIVQILKTPEGAGSGDPVGFAAAASSAAKPDAAPGGPGQPAAAPAPPVEKIAGDSKV
jgi:biopolymer transport protein ExbB